MSADETWLSDWHRRQEAGHEAWKGGATTKEIARILDVTVESARKAKKKWARREIGPKINGAITALHEAGFSPEEIAGLLDIEPAWAKSKIDASAVERLPFLERPISELELSTRATNVLAQVPVSNIGEMRGMRKLELRTIKGCGQGTLDEIVAEFARHGVHLAD